MNIVLTQKDADFILKYIRMDAQRVDESFESLKKRETELLSKCNSPDVANEPMIRNIMEITTKAGNVVKAEMEELKKDFTRCIELLTVGSEVAE